MNDVDARLAMFGYTGPDRVERFQAQHLRPDGTPLAVDGIVGPNTYAALSLCETNQRLGLEGEIPEGIEGDRAAFLHAALEYHENGMREVPMGSNRVPGLEKRAQGKPWCDFWVHQCYHDVASDWLFGGYRGSTKMSLRQAKNAGLIKAPGQVILPGDVGFVLGTDHKPVHTYIVLRCGSPDVYDLNTVEGNVSNRVAVRERSVPVVWYDPWGDTEARRWDIAMGMEYGLLPNVRRAGGESTR